MPSEHGRDVLLLGSIPLANAEQVFRTVAGIIGDRAPRITDGETGKRLAWIESQAPIFDDHPMFQRGSAEAGKKVDWRSAQADEKMRIKPWHFLRPGTRANDLTFGPLGYAIAAKESYALFSRLKREGVIPKTCRFQVSLPTPYNVIDQRIAPTDRLAVEPAYERAMLEEINDMAAAIPHTELAIQWDIAHEIQNLEGGRPHWFENPEQGIIDRIARISNSIPADVELGLHFCYGDFNHTHLIEPKDMRLMVGLANALSIAIKRPINWIHMPVPRGRNDDVYFAPLKELKLKPETRLYLGLVHYTDGVAGAQARLQAAYRVISDFGIAAECGFGRRRPETVLELLRIHAAVADLAA